MTPPNPEEMKDPDAVRRLMVNAERLGRLDIAEACKRRIYQLSGSSEMEPVERRLWQAVTAYEETLREKHGRAQKASYTRRKIRDKGPTQTLIDWAIADRVTPGFEALVKVGMAEFTGEYVVVEFADQFSDEVVEAAKQKLLIAGMKVEELPY